VENETPPGGPLSPLADDLVRLLGWVLIGGLVLSAGSLAVCRVTAGAGGLAPQCAELLPALERKHEDALQTLVTLLAGAGIGRQH
jgi:hypothetical protein